MAPTTAGRKWPWEDVWGFRTSKLRMFSIWALNQFDDRPIRACHSALFHIDFPIDFRIRSESKHGTLTGAGAPSSSESILMASTCAARGCWMFSSLQPGKIVLSSLCKYHSSSLLGVFLHLHTRYHRLLPLLWSSCCPTQTWVWPGVFFGEHLLSSVWKRKRLEMIWASIFTQRIKSRKWEISSFLPILGPLFTLLDPFPHLLSNPEHSLREGRNIT